MTLQRITNNVLECLCALLRNREEWKQRDAPSNVLQRRLFSGTVTTKQWANDE